MYCYNLNRISLRSLKIPQEWQRLLTPCKRVATTSTSGSAFRLALFRHLQRPVTVRRTAQTYSATQSTCWTIDPRHLKEYDKLAFLRGLSSMLADWPDAHEIHRHVNDSTCTNPSTFVQSTTPCLSSQCDSKGATGLSA